MATRTKLVDNTDVDQVFEDVGVALTPPNGIKWTFVELSAGFGPVTGVIQGTARVKFDEEIYHEIHSSIHNTLGAENQKNKEIIAIDVVQPHKLQVQAKGDADNLSFKMQLTLEESAVVG